MMIDLQLTHQELAVMTKIEAKNHFERVVQRLGVLPNKLIELTLYHFCFSLRRELDACEKFLTATRKEVFPPVCNREPQLAGL